MFSRRVVTALIAIPTAAILIACGSGSKDNSPQEGPGAQKQSTPASAPTAKPKYKHTIVMEITGPAKADITYLLGSDTSQDNGAKLPWKKTLHSNDDLVFASVSGQSKSGSDSSKISCKLTIDGKSKPNTSTGAYAIVDCNMTSAD
jgi:hypothetical protein